MKKIIQAPFMWIGCMCLHIAYLLDDAEYFYNFLEKYGLYYPEEEKLMKEQEK